ncbi:hypothetical protein BGZ67_001402 [Mortierella alpina]|nr:hypothetical protein BGZ67_001402 [Mortierella alpina]
MEGLDNCNPSSRDNTTSSSGAVGGILALGLPLDSYASAPARRLSSNALAVCIAHETSKGASCYVYSTCLCGSGACEQSRQVGISEETVSFVKEMKQFPSANGDAAHPSKSDHDRGRNEGCTAYDLDGMVDATLTITSNDSKMNTWLGFKSEGALYLRGNGWDDMDIRESVVAALDLAEEQLECTVVYLCLEKSNPHLSKLVRALMYAGFEAVHPGVLPHADSKYLVLGMEL